MASQVTCNIQKVGPSATQDTLKSLRSLDEGKTSIVTVRVTRKWEELDFMSTNDVTSIDMVIVDEQGEELHAVIPKNLIWKFDKLIREGGLYSMQKLHLPTAKPKFRPAHNEKRAFFRSTTSITAKPFIKCSLQRGFQTKSFDMASQVTCRPHRGRFLGKTGQLQELIGPWRR
ncbi:hypothetical protein C5167_030935 [Papaver somniferum]|nr:hypothetical protein C5167_030935 [Papaver somniferum]